MIQSLEEIPGWTHYWQHDYFPELVKLLPDNPNVLELGCGYGRSTWAWLNALPLHTKFYIVDNFTLEDYNSQTQKEYFLNTIEQHPKFTVIKKIFHEDYESWEKNNNLNFDLVYIDADHRYEQITKQLEYFKNVPILCGDDYEYKHPGVVKAVDEFKVKYTKKFTLIKNFFILQ